MAKTISIPTPDTVVKWNCETPGSSGLVKNLVAILKKEIHGTRDNSQAKRNTEHAFLKHIIMQKTYTFDFRMSLGFQRYGSGVVMANTIQQALELANKALEASAHELGIGKSVIVETDLKELKPNTAIITDDGWHEND